MTAQAYTNRLRLLAVANNTKVQYTRGIAVNNNPIYSTIGCKPNFKSITYVLKRSCKIACVDAPCYTQPILNGGSPSSTPTYFVNGGYPGIIADCYIDEGPPSTGCYNLPILNGGDVTAPPQYVVDGQDVSVIPVCFIDFRVI
jgi:hypothetical protein